MSRMLDVIVALKESSSTQGELIEKLVMDKNTVRKCLRMLQAKGLARPAGWRKRTQSAIVWELQ